MHTTLHHETGYVLTLTISDINGKCKEEGTCTQHFKRKI